MRKEHVHKQASQSHSRRQGRAYQQGHAQKQSQRKRKQNDAYGRPRRKRRSCLATLIIGLIEFVLIMTLLPLLAIGWMNGSMILSSMGDRVTVQEAKAMEPVDMIVVLGASVHGSEPSDILKDRLDQAIRLYKAGVSKKILMTGDGQSEYYNEVRTMKSYAMKKGVPKSAIRTDPEGLSTYDSMENIARKYDKPSVMIVTQKYHISRAMYIARKKGMTVYGCCAKQKHYKDTTAESKREIAARCKDYLVLLLDGVLGSE